MKIATNLMVPIVLYLLLMACKDREPLNPLDPDNPTTRGQGYTLQADVTGIGKVSVSWRRVNLQQVKEYRLYRAAEGGAASAIANPTGTSFIDAQLQPGKVYSYFYRLVWEDGRELHQSPAVSATTFDAPTGLTITTVTRSRVEMRWDDLQWLDNYTLCRIYRSSGGAFSLHDSTSSNQYADTRVDTGITYRYKLLAVATDGNQSNLSTETYATPANSTPVIDSIKLSQPITGWGEQVTITCFAHDSDGDTIRYAWQALEGGIVSGSGRVVTFRVPQDSVRTHRVMVTVSDNYSIGSSASAAVESAQLVLSEGFDSYVVGTFPSSGGWRLVWNGAGTSSQVVTNTVSLSPPNSMQMKGAYAWSAAMDHAISSNREVVWFEVKMRISARGDGGVGIWNLGESTWGQYYCYVYFGTDGRIFLGYGRDGLEGSYPTVNYQPNQWYKVKVKYTTLTGRADVWVNDTIAAQNVQLFSGGVGYREFLLRGGWSGQFLNYDDARVWVQ